jgi:MYXO-CTERM domain-containing protein
VHGRALHRFPAGIHERRHDPAGAANDGVLDPGEVDQVEYVCAPAAPVDGDVDAEDADEVSCSTAPGTSGFGMLAALLALVLRRRR